jgi:hypothetical protein
MQNPDGSDDEEGSRSNSRVNSRASSPEPAFSEKRRKKAKEEGSKTSASAGGDSLPNDRSPILFCPGKQGFYALRVAMPSAYRLTWITNLGLLGYLCTSSLNMAAFTAINIIIRANHACLRTHYWAQSRTRLHVSHQFLSPRHQIYAWKKHSLARSCILRRRPI